MANHCKADVQVVSRASDAEPTYVMLLLHSKAEPTLAMPLHRAEAAYPPL